MPNSIF